MIAKLNSMSAPQSAPPPFTTEYALASIGRPRLLPSGLATCAVSTGSLFLICVSSQVATAPFISKVQTASFLTDYAVDYGISSPLLMAVTGGRDQWPVPQHGVNARHERVWRWRRRRSAVKRADHRPRGMRLIPHVAGFSANAIARFCPDLLAALVSTQTLLWARTRQCLRAPYEVQTLPSRIWEQFLISYLGRQGYLVHNFTAQQRLESLTALGLASACRCYMTHPRRQGWVGLIPSRSSGELAVSAKR